mgnify:CR=1 FL=1
MSFNTNFSLLKFLSVNGNKDLDSVCEENESIDENFHSNLNFSDENKEKGNEEEEKEKKCSSSYNNSNALCSSGISDNSLISLQDKGDNDNDEKSDLLSFIDNPFLKSIENDQNLFSLPELAQNKKKELIFKITYSPKYSLFNKTKVGTVLDEDDEKGETQSFLKQKRILIKSRKENRDNIRKKIKRGFFNNVLPEKLNDKLRMIDRNEYFIKFPQFFASDVDKNRNKIIVDMSLKEIFENSELYSFEDKDKDKNGYDKYLHNKKVVEKIKNNDIFKKILSKTFRELYEEYLDSDEFKIDEINRLKESKMENHYIRRYKDIAKDLINFFC